MRTKLLLAAAVTFVTLSAGAAPQGAGSERVTVVGAQPKQTKLEPFMFDKLQGEYALEDGRVLTVTGKVEGRNRSLYADLGAGPTEIVHVGRNRFVAIDKDLRLSFERAPARDVPQFVRVSDRAGRQVASTQP
jgi:hypothetical protein